MQVLPHRATYSRIIHAGNGCYQEMESPSLQLTQMSKTAPGVHMAPPPTGTGFVMFAFCGHVPGPNQADSVRYM